MKRITDDVWRSGHPESKHIRTTKVVGRNGAALY